VVVIPFPLTIPGTELALLDELKEKDKSKGGSEEEKKT
jgi:hypothetical protein